MLCNPFKRFSVFVECSTGSTPKVQTLKKYIDLISAFGYNEMYLGCTNAYKIEEAPYFNYKRGGYTREDFRELDIYAKRRGVTLIASVQTLAHLRSVSRHNVYADIFDTEDILLVGEEKTYAFIDKIFKAISEGLSARRIHIGFDEAFGLGMGNYLKKHGFREKRELLAEHLAKVTEIARKYGYTCEIWADMFLSESESMSEGCVRFPSDGTEIVAWNYDEADEKALDELLGRVRDICPRAAFAGAAWKINGFAPQNGYSLSRLIPQMKSCIKNGIEHFMITLWSDGGGLVSIYSVLPVLYAAAQFATGEWNGEGGPDKEAFGRIAECDYDALYSLEYLNDPFRKELRTKNSRSYWCLFNDMFLGNYDLYLSEGTGAKYALLADEYEKTAGGNYGYLFSLAAALARLLSVKAELGLKVRAAYRRGDKAELNKIVDDFSRLLTYLVDFTEKFESYWERENMAFGVECVQILLGGQIARYRYAERKLIAFVERDEKIEELETETLPPSIIPQTDEDRCFEMNWRFLTTFCDI